MRAIRKAPLALVALLALLLTTEAMAADDDDSGSRRLSPFVLKDTAGHDYNVAQHIGRDVVIVGFWATWCKPCKIEMKALHELYLKHKDEGLVVLAVSIDGPDSIAEVANYKRKFGYTFPVLLDQETSVLEQYNPRGSVPFSMMVNRQGVITESHAGFKPGDEVQLENHILHWLAEEPALGAGDAGAEAAPEFDGQGYWRKALKPRVEGSESLEIRWRGERFVENSGEDGVVGIHNKLTLTGISGPLQVGGRVDNNAYPQAEPCAPGSNRCPWEDEHRIEKYWAQYKTRNLLVRGGDFYGSMGRGMVFSVRKLDEIGLDTTIRGGKAVGTVGPVTLRAMGGTSNVQNMDLDIAGRLEDQKDRLAGGEISVALPADMTLAARGLWVDYFENEGSARDNGDWTVGGSFEVRNIADILTIYAEGAFIKNQAELSVLGNTKDNSTEGHGLYVSVQLNPMEGLVLLLEGKDYRRFDISPPGSPLTSLRYAEPPNLERFDQIVPSSENATGGRLKAEYYIKPIGLLVGANVVYYGWSEPNDFDEEETVDNFAARSETVMHSFIELEKKWDNGIYLNVSAGYRREGINTIESVEQKDYHRKLWHAEVDAQFPLAGTHSLGIRAQHRSEQTNKPVGDDGDFARGDVALTYAPISELSLGVIYTYQTEFPTQPEFDNFAGEVAWAFAEWGELNVLGGRLAGGLICVGGVCRLFPVFEGVKLTFRADF